MSSEEQKLISEYIGELEEMKRQVYGSAATGITPAIVTFAKLVAVLSRQTERLQKWMMYFTIAIAILTFVLVILTIALFFKK